MVVVLHDGGVARLVNGRQRNTARQQVVQPRKRRTRDLQNLYSLNVYYNETMLSFSLDSTLHSFAYNILIRLAFAPEATPLINSLVFVSVSLSSPMLPAVSHLTFRDENRVPACV